MAQLHTYETELVWTGNRGTGTSGYRSYDRTYDVSAPGRPAIEGSADPGVAPGDPTRWNPEQLLLASLSQCHLLWYLHFCTVSGVIVTGYTDHAHATMEMVSGVGGGRFTEAVLRPHIEVASAEMTEKAIALHADANRACFIANSVNFPVRHEPMVTVSSAR